MSLGLCVVDFLKVFYSMFGGSTCVNFSHYMCQRRYYFEVLCKGALVFPISLLSKFLIFTYLKHLKHNLNFIFALNLDIIYLLEFLV